MHACVTARVRDWATQGQRGGLSGAIQKTYVQLVVSLVTPSHQGSP